MLLRWDKYLILNVKIDIRLALIIYMYDSFHENNPRSDKDRPIPTIRPVIRSDEQLKVLQDIISSPRISQNVKKRFMAEKAGGYCSVCGGVATQIASYDMIDATLVEKYCDTCLERKIN
ncbi:MAG: hypothetical protein ACP5OH_06815 [Nitrososphaerota archaeon]